MNISEPLKITLEGLGCLGLGIAAFIYIMKETNNGTKISSVYDFNVFLASIVATIGSLVMFYIGMKGL